MLTQSVMEEFSFLQSVIDRNVEPASFAYAIQSDIQSEIDKYKKKLLSETVAELKTSKVLRENYLAGCFKYLDCLDYGNPNLMSPVDLYHLDVVFNLSWGYLAVCIIAYAENGQGLFMKDFIASLQGNCKLDNLFNVAKSHNITDGKTLVGYINKACKNDPVEEALQSLRRAGFIDNSNTPINGTTEQELAGMCQYLSQTLNINNWASAFAERLNKTSSNLTSAASNLTNSPNYNTFLNKRSKLK